MASFLQFEIPRQRALAALLVIAIVAGGLRLVRPDISPPGMNVDEAGDLWNSWCLYKEGKDQHGVSWPIFRLRTFGTVDNRSTLFQYYLIPFLAVRGFSLATARFSMAISGLLTILLLYYLTASLYGRGMAIVAAALLALLPWHIQQSRWAHQGGFQPFLTALSVAAVLWARLPLGGRRGEDPSPGKALAAGVVTGVCCYGYQSLRIFLPLFFTAAVFANCHAWLALLKSRRGRGALGLFMLGLTLTFGPLVWKHLTDPEMNARGSVTWVFAEHDPLLSKAGKVIGRYFPHFGPSFLFERGDKNASLLGPKGYGVLLWYHAVLLIAGVAVLAVCWQQSTAGRVALLWLLFYPVGDLLTQHPSPHLLRSQPGMLGLVLVCAVGAMAPLQWLWRRRRIAGGGAVAVLMIVALSTTGRYLGAFFGPYNQESIVSRVNQVDFLRALDWLKANGGHYDQVFITASGVPHPYIYTVVRTEMTPADWFKAEKVVKIGPAENGAHPLEDVYYRVGRYRFIYDRQANDELSELSANGRDDRVLLLVEPNKIRMGGVNSRLVQEFRFPNGEVALQAVELVI